MDKIIRIPGDNLSVPITELELHYRNKFLPDPQKLDDVKLVCTVCSISLATKVHEGADLYIHRALSVLVCQDCYEFYGNGNFSVDEDNDDKYCRWCGQGGTLYVCASCTCAFCKKCVRQNMKPSALADLEKDDWRCYICVPRPLYGCRTICWAAQKLNLIGKEKKRLKLKSQAEKLKHIAEMKKTKNQNKKIMSIDEDDRIPKKRKNREDSESEDDCTSNHLTPQKKVKTNGESHKINSTPGKSNSASKTETAHPNKHKSPKKLKHNSSSRHHDTSSESEVEKVSVEKKFSNSRTKCKISSDSDSDQTMKLKKHNSKTKTKLKVNKAKTDTTSGSSSDSLYSSVKKHRRKKVKHKRKTYRSSSESTDSDVRRQKRKKLKKRKRNRTLSETKNTSEESGNKVSTSETKLVVDVPHSNFGSSEMIHSNSTVNTNHTGSNCGSINDDGKLTQIVKEVDPVIEDDALAKTPQVLATVNEHTEDSAIGEDVAQKTKQSSSDQSNSLIHPTEEAKSEDQIENVASVVDEAVEENIRSAITWLENTVDDIGELGEIISVQANKFSERKIQLGNMTSSEEVLETLTKLKQFIKGIHDNYNEIETNMDRLVNPWKIKVGLEKNEIVEEEKEENINATINSECSTNDRCDNNTQSNDVPNIAFEGHDTHPAQSVNEVEGEKTEGLIPSDSSLQPETSSMPVSVDSEIPVSASVDSINNAETVDKVNTTDVSTVESNDDLAKPHNTSDPPLADSIDAVVSKDASGEADKCSVEEPHLKPETLTDPNTTEENLEEIKLEPQEVDIKIESDELQAESLTETNVEESILQMIKSEPMEIEKDTEANELLENREDVQDLSVSSIKMEEPLDPLLATLDKNDSAASSSSKIITHNEEIEHFEKEISKSDRLIERLGKNLNEILNPEENEDKSESIKEASIDIVTINPEVQEKDNFEALQAMLYSSSDDEFSSSSDSDDSSDIQLDDSELDEKKTLKKVVSTKSKPKDAVQENAKDEEPLNEETDVTKRDSQNDVKNNHKTGNDDKRNHKTEKLENHIEKENGTDSENVDENMEENHNEDSKLASKSADQPPKQAEELDSEEEINMLTDINQLKKKTTGRKPKIYTSSEENSDSDESESSSDSEVKIDSRKGMKYKNESKKRREEDRNELFGFLDKNSNSEGELDITKGDLDNLEDQYASSSSDSMSLQVFSKKLSEKWKEMEKEQEDMNLKILLASESDEDTQGRDDISSDSDKDKKKEKASKKKASKDKNSSENEDDDKDKPEELGSKSDEEIVVKEENQSDNELKIKGDDEYERFLDGILSKKIKFEGLGSSSEENQSENEKSPRIKLEKENNEEDVKQESLKKMEVDLDSDSSDSSILLEDIFAKDKEKEKNMMKKMKKHKVLNIKLSDTDTSDEERWWQRRLEKDRKKKEEGEERKRNERTPQKKMERKKSRNDKEKSVKTKSDDSSTLELSSTESSGSDVFKKKKKKKAKSSGSDGSSGDDKKKKKKRKNLSGDSSDDSSNNDSDVIAISQKSNQGESPKGTGRKNIRKLMTKHELAAATKAAAKEEEERKKRIAARQKLFNEIFEVKEAEVLEKLVLDFDPETKTELIAVEKDLVTKMKPHQAKGVKFMWDSCFESLSQMKTNKGSGCILAHCMGLGKTFQVISLVHTILKHKDTNVNSVLVVCPLSTVLNWYNEFDKWLDDVHKGRDIKIYHLTKFKKAHERSRQLLEWKRTGGVMILGYEMFRILTNPDTKKFRLTIKETFQETLIDPGADLVVCDEGHMLKNESTILSKAMSRIKTLRRIVLTGTPMQNNLKEYHCMVQFVKPNLLGTRKEFLNQFVNPITNGQFVDSTEADVKVMKRRSHVLHKMLEGLVQRFDYNVLTPFLPPKHEYVISIRLTELQVKLYQYYLDHFSQKSNQAHRSGSQLFADWQALSRIWTHPYVLKLTFEKNEKEKQKKAEEETEEENNSSDGKGSSIKLSSSSHSSSSSDSEDNDKKDKVVKTSLPIKNGPDGLIEAEINLISSDEEQVEQSNTNEPKETSVATELAENTENAGGNIAEAVNGLSNNENDENADKEPLKEKEDTEGTGDTEGKGDNEGKVDTEKKDDIEGTTESANKIEEDTSQKEEEMIKDVKSDWWRSMIEPDHFEDLNQSGKLFLLFAILKECEMIEDKVLVFSQSLFSLDLVEYFLNLVDQTTEESLIDEVESSDVSTGSWKKGIDYFRLDGSSAPEQRNVWCKAFNREDNPRARLFLISTRAGGLGINLTGANRVVIFDASWNPSHDIQSIFRIYRFGQKKPCYVYRFIANGTMEEKVYDRQVAKQSLSSRVVDEQQVERHFSTNDLTELYRFTPPGPIEDRPTPALPKDRLMAELLTQHKIWIEKYHEHDSLLENISEEELNEEERKLAWEDYENEKKRDLMPATGQGFQNSALSGLANKATQMEYFRRSLMNKFMLQYPNASESEMNAMLATLMNQMQNRTAQNAQQFVSQAQGQPSTSNTTNPFPKTNQPLSREQIYNVQRNNLMQKYGQQLPNNTQRMGNHLMRQTQQNKVKVNRGQGNYLYDMRKQHESNLERIINQHLFQNNTTQSNSNVSSYRNQQTSSSQSQQSQNGNTAQSISQIANRQQAQNRQSYSNSQPVANRGFNQNITQRQNQTATQNRTQFQNQTATPNRTQLQNQAAIQNRKQLQNQATVQNRTQLQNQAAIRNRTQLQNQTAIRNRTQIQNQAGIQNQTAISNQQNQRRMLNNRVQQNRLPVNNQPSQNGNVQNGNRSFNTSSRVNGTPSTSRSTNMIPRITRVESLQNKPAVPRQKLSHEEMQQRISRMQQEKQRSIQQNLANKAKQNARSSATSTAHQRQLEEMSNRYRASRQGQQSTTPTSEINIVEIDDDV